ncbi:MAG: acyltransferase family protein [Rickettsiales bacterium]
MMRNSTLDILRIVACFAVVGIHVYAPVFQTAPVQSALWWQANLVTAFSRWSVPVFVMLSGYLLLDKPYNLSRRLLRIGIPLIVWTAIYLLFTHLFYEQLSLEQVLRKIISGKPYYHLYFLFIMLGLAVVTPLLNRVLAYLTRSQFRAMLGILFLLVIAHKLLGLIWPQIVMEPNAFTFFIRFLPFYLLGYEVRDWRVSPRVLIPVFLFMCLLAAGWNAMAYIYWHKNAYAFAYLNPLIILTALLLFLLALQMPVFPIPKYILHLSDCTLGIYLIHPIWLAMGVSFLPPIVLWCAAFLLSYGCIAFVRTIPLARNFVG